MSTAGRRKAITIQADPYKDGDLIHWHSRIPEGQKQQRLKDILRRGIASEKRDMDALNSVEDLRYGLEMVRGDIAGLAAIMQKQLPKQQAGGQSVDMQKLLATALTQLLSGQQAQSVEPEIEAGPRLEDTEIAERERAVRNKAKWKRG